MSTEDINQVGAAARIWSLRTIAAAAITAVALSGVGGAALAAAGRNSGGDQLGRGGGGFGGPPGFRQQLPQTGQPNGVQVPRRTGHGAPPAAG